MNSLQVSPSQIQPNAWNPNRMDDFMFAKELESIRRFGFVVPVVVRSTVNGFEIIDGEHRWRAALELNLDDIPIWDLGPMSESAAKQLTIVLNETRGRADKQLLSKLLQELLITEPTQSLAQVMPFDESTFADLAKLVNFDFAQLEQDMHREASTDPTRWVERMYRLPHDVAEVLDQALAKVKDNVKRELDDELTDWQALEVLAAEYLAGN